MHKKNYTASNFPLDFYDLWTPRSDFFRMMEVKPEKILTNKKAYHRR